MHFPRALPLVLLAALGCSSSAETPVDDAGPGPGESDGTQGDGDGTGDGTSHDGSSGDGDGEPGPEFDASALFVEGESGLPLCVLSDDGRTLLVSVKNGGTTTTYETDVELKSVAGELALRVQTPVLFAGEAAVLRFDRGPVAGYVPGWQFALTVDPDERHGPPHEPLQGECQDMRSRAADAMGPLAAFYNQDSGLWGMNDWWTSANQLETVIDYTRETSDARWIDEIDHTFERNKADDFDKWGYYDDDGWWAMAWIKAYDLTHQAKYLDMAKAIFARMTRGWTDQCGGGIYWASPKAGEVGNKNKNAIPNSLFLQIAAKLHQRTPGDQGPGSFLDWAEREWAWFEASGMIDDRNLVVDGLNNLTDCHAEGPVFTYNTGVLVGGLVDLAKATGNDAYLERALGIARATIQHMSEENGILKETPCGGDICVQFKGVFMRNLAHLYRARPLPELLVYMRKQSDWLWNHHRNPEGRYGYEWHLPYDTTTPGRQSSALDALIAAVSASNLNLALTGAASGSGACSAAETHDRAIDGNPRGTKWCAGGGGAKELVVDLGTAREVTGFRVQHAGAGGENAAWNTRDFQIATSMDGQSYASQAEIAGNTESVTTHPIAAVKARYVKLTVTGAQTATDFMAVRIYEFEVFGAGLE